VSDELLGDEWGTLAGLPAEEALKVVAAYATELEEKGDASSDDTPRATPKADDVLDRVKQMKQQSMAPAATEFVGRRETARAKARKAVVDQGHDWDAFSVYIEEAMQNATAEQQVEPAAWYEAFKFVWGQSAWQHAQTPADAPNDDEPAANTPPRNEGARHVVEVGVPGSMNVGKGDRRVDVDSTKFKITDPEEMNVKRNFERMLGKKIPDEEWGALQHEEINTLDDYEDLQKRVEKKGGK